MINAQVSPEVPEICNRMRRSFPEAFSELVLILFFSIAETAELFAIAGIFQSRRSRH